MKAATTAAAAAAASLVPPPRINLSYTYLLECLKGRYTQAAVATAPAAQMILTAASYYKSSSTYLLA